MSMFRISQYDDQTVIVQPEQNHPDYGALVQDIKDAPEAKWTRQYGLRGWLMPANQLTLQWIEDRYREDHHYHIDAVAKMMMMREKIERAAQMGRANKRWEYLFEGKKSEFPVPHNGMEPMDHQRVAIESMIDMPHFALLMEMGTGKTYCVIKELEHYWLRNDEPYRALIVCPKSLRENWRRELIKFTSDYYTTDFRVLDSGVKAGEEIVSLMQSDARVKVGIISYDAIKSIAEIVRAIFPHYICFDESHYLKNSSTKRYKCIKELTDFIRDETGGKIRILTGTPVSNKITDLWPQFQVLRPGILGASTLKGFANMYAHLEQHGDWTVMTGYKNVEQLKELMGRNSFIVKKSECMDLPDKMYETRYIEMGKEHRKIYDEYAQTLTTQINGKVLETNVIIAQLMKLAQMTSGFVRVPVQDTQQFALDGQSIFDYRETTDMETVEIPEGDRKMNEMLNECEQVVKESKLIIWCRFIHDIEKITFELQMRGIRCVNYYGKRKDKELQDAVDSFNENDEVRVFIGQTRKGGVGLTLLGNTDNYFHTTRTVFFYSNSYSYQDRSQAEDRCHRKGQTNKVTYVDWVYEHSIDEVIARCLQDKKDIADMIKDVNEIKDILLSGDF